MSVFSLDVQLRCGVPDIEPIPELPAISGCLIGDIPILEHHAWIIPMDGERGCDGIDGLDGQDAPDTIDGVRGCNGIDGLDGQDAPDALDGRHGCDGVNGIDGQDAADSNDGQRGCRGIDGLDGQDAPESQDVMFSDHSFILDGCLAADAKAGVSQVAVFPECDPANGTIQVVVPYPGDIKDVLTGHPVRYYLTRNNRYMLLDLPCSPQ